jgi:cellulose synthase/poly-beta-1,6-N-acetylglucosamine synthase-like glycosyltransferase
MVAPTPPRVSIIIPCQAISSYAIESVGHCRQLDYPNYEIIVLPDAVDPTKDGMEGITVIPTGPVGPSEKRDLAAQHATGEILAFIDDDAYPRADWLTNAVVHFSSDRVGGVGGPAVTPPADGHLQRASGAVYQSIMGGGPYGYRYVPRAQREVDDYPTCNLLIRKSTFLEAGGFGTDFWPGEDTKLCLTITKRLEKTIVYEPDVLVYHHRRNVLKGHLKQVASYALHRGHFVRKLPETSRLPAYFLPTALIASLIGGAPALFFPVLREFYLAWVGFYLLLVLLSSIHATFPSLRLAFLTFIGTLLTHFVYGIWFVKGLTATRLER